MGGGLSSNFNDLPDAMKANIKYKNEVIGLHNDFNEMANSNPAFESQLLVRGSGKISIDGWTNRGYQEVFNFEIYDDYFKNRVKEMGKVEKFENITSIVKSLPSKQIVI